MILKYISLIAAIIAMNSCSRQVDTDNIPKNDNDSSEFVNENIPVAFEDKGIQDDIKSYGRLNKFGNNPINKLFTDYLETDEQLESVIESFNSLYKDGKEIDSQINEFINNNDKYYSAAETLAESIKDNDTLVYELILSKIRKSKTEYSKQQKSYHQLSRFEKDIFDSWNAYLNAIKILKTLEMVEKYQKVEDIDKESFEEIIHKQDDLINDLKERIK